MKELFVWSDKYSVNNEEIDSQHKVIFSIFNRLSDCCLKHKAHVTFEALTYELLLYAEYHFSTEEEYMRSLGYKDIDNHMAEHKIFTDKILQLQSNNLLNENVTLKELIVYFWNWITNHVLEEDKKMHLVNIKFQAQP